MLVLGSDVTVVVLVVVLGRDAVVVVVVVEYLDVLDVVVNVDVPGDEDDGGCVEVDQPTQLTQSDKPVDVCKDMNVPDAALES